MNGLENVLKSLSFVIQVVFSLTKMGWTGLTKANILHA